MKVNSHGFKSRPYIMACCVPSDYGLPVPEELQFFSCKMEKLIAFTSQRLCPGPRRWSDRVEMWPRAKLR